MPIKIPQNELSLLIKIRIPDPIPFKIPSHQVYVGSLS